MPGFIAPLSSVWCICHVWLYATITTSFVHLSCLVLYHHFGWLRTSVISGFIAPFRLASYICHIWFYSTISTGFVHLSYLVLYHHFGWLRTSVISGFIPPLWLASYMMMNWCLMSSDVMRHIRDKLWPMPKHGAINLYVHGNQKARLDGQPRTSTSTLTQLLNYGVVHLSYLVLYHHYVWLRTSVISGFIPPFRLASYICYIWFYIAISAGFVHLSYLVL